MVVRHCIELLLELSRLEQRIAEIQDSKPKNKQRDKEILERHLKKIQPLS